jgi:hypothetical protein
MVDHEKDPLGPQIPVNLPQHALRRQQAERQTPRQQGSCGPGEKRLAGSRRTKN